MLLQLIADTLDAMTGAPGLCSMDGHESLIRKIIAVHLVYRQCRSEVLQFGQLVLHRPGILKSLSDMSLSDRAGLVSVLSESITIIKTNGAWIRDGCMMCK